jgi:hypothetical protein
MGPEHHPFRPAAAGPSQIRIFEMTECLSHRQSGNIRHGHRKINTANSPIARIISSRQNKQESRPGPGAYFLHYPFPGKGMRKRKRPVPKNWPISLIRWSGRRDSNSRPLAPHASALPGCATPRRAAHYTDNCAAVKCEVTQLWIPVRHAARQTLPAPRRPRRNGPRDRPRPGDCGLR